MDRKVLPVRKMYEREEKLWPTRDYLLLILSVWSVREKYDPRGNGITHKEKVWSGGKSMTHVGNVCMIHERKVWPMRGRYYPWGKSMVSEGKVWPLEGKIWPIREKYDPWGKSTVRKKYCLWEKSIFLCGRKLCMVSEEKCKGRMWPALLAKNEIIHTQNQWNIISHCYITVEYI